MLLAIISVLLLLPFAGPILSIFAPAGEVWSHMQTHLLPRYALDTLRLSLGVLLLGSLLAIPGAWIISRYDFPLRSFFDRLMVFPLAIPAYIGAYAWTGIFEYQGPVWRLGLALGLPEQSLAVLGIRGMGGLIFVMAVSLYPYIYLLMRQSFSHYMTSSLEAARGLGLGSGRQFFRLALPMARPALVAGLSVVLMEVLNEFGAVAYYGQNTLTTGIFRAWFGYYDLDAARRLGGLLMLSVLLLVALEQGFNGGRSYRERRQRELSRLVLSGLPALGAILTAALPPLLGFIFPLLQLSGWAGGALATVRWEPIFEGMVNTLALALGSGGLILAGGLLIANARRLHGKGLLRRLSDLSLLGHAVPGAVIALGVLGISRSLSLISGGGIALTGSMILLMCAYVVRFMAVGQRPVSAVLEHQLGVQDEAARSLGSGPWEALGRIHLPRLRGPMLGAFALLFLEMVKELPLTMILRPFNFSTLAVRTYELAANEMLMEASVPALILALIGTLGVGLIQRRVR